MARPAHPRPDVEADITVRRATQGIFAGVVLATCGVFAAVTMAPVVAYGITGSAFLAGTPVAAALAGAGIGASRVTALISRYGHQRAFAAAYLLGAGACLLATVAVAIASFALLILGLAGIGMGHAANQLARYAAAELHAEQRRPTVIGWMVWAQAIGAVLGPLSLSPAGRVSTALTFPVEAGGFLVGAVLFALAAASHARAPRYRAAEQPSPDATALPAPAISSWRLPTVQVAVVTMAAAFGVMFMVMAVTPVHVHSAGHGVAGVGAIMSAHTFGMFALAPLAGWLTGRFGSLQVIVAGLATLLFAALAGAAAPAGSQPLLATALFVLGFGWCLAFVAASALLSRGLVPAVRVRLQGRVEAITWISGAGAALSSGLLLGLIGFSGVNLLACGILTVPFAVIVVQRRVVAQHRVGHP
ncbi:MAG: MFS transporter [Actinomycetota bacterium]